MYMDMADLVHRNFFDSGWSNKKLSRLSEKFQNFEFVEYKKFRAYQASKLKTQKLHALDNVCGATREAGDLVHLRVGLFRCSHKIFTEAYCLTSK